MKLFKTRDEALIFWQTQSPLLKCDYIIKISNSRSDSFETDAFAVITGFTFPDSPLRYEVKSFGIATPRWSPTSSITITYMVPEGYPSDVASYWSRQFNDDGIPVYYPVSERPIIQIMRKTSTGWENVASLEGCLFGFPKPQIAYDSLDYATFTMDVNYTNILISDKSLTNRGAVISPSSIDDPSGWIMLNSQF